MNRPEISLICAMDQNRLIGNNNQLPWHLPADLILFKKATLGKPIIMGRKTFDSIGKALPGRQNIVVTRAKDWRAENCDTAHSIDQAIALAGDVPEVMIIGGANLYQQAINIADNIYLTRVNAIFSGDAWFPTFSGGQWAVSSEEKFEAGGSNEYSFSFIKYTRCELIR